MFYLYSHKGNINVFYVSHSFSHVIYNILAQIERQVFKILSLWIYAYITAKSSFCK